MELSQKNNTDQLDLNGRLDKKPKKSSSYSIKRLGLDFSNQDEADQPSIAVSQLNEPSTGGDTENGIPPLTRQSRKLIRKLVRHARVEARYTVRQAKSSVRMARFCTFVALLGLAIGVIMMSKHFILLERQLISEHQQSEQIQSRLHITQTRADYLTGELLQARTNIGISQERASAYKKRDSSQETEIEALQRELLTANTEVYRVKFLYDQMRAELKLVQQQKKNQSKWVQILELAGVTE